MSVVVRALLTGVTVLALAGCSTVDHPGSPPPEQGRTLPPRPMSVSAARIPPCSMLAPDQVERLGLRSPTAGQVNVDGLPSSGCSWLGSEIDYNVQVIPVDAEVATNLPGADVTRVGGFGAVRNVPESSDGPSICQVTIDVAQEQSIRVQASPLPSRPYGMDELCRRADEAASMVMTTVVANAPR